MKRFRHILMIYSDNPKHFPALAHVIGLATRTGAHLTMVDVMEDLPPATSIIKDTLDIQLLRSDAIRERKEQMEATVRELDGDPVQIATKVLTGNPPIAIIREVLENGHDLVAKPAMGPDTGLGGRLFGSTAIKLLRKCPVPVWVIKPAVEIRYRRILAAVDPMFRQTGDNRLNDLILSLAVSIAGSEKAHLDILHCWRLEGESLLSSGRTRMAEGDFNRLLSKARQQVQQQFDELIQAHPLEGIDCDVHLERGHVGLILPTFIEMEGIDLVVMGTLSRTGISGLITGNTAEKIFHNADCSVLAVKPPDFVSPVTL